MELEDYTLEYRRGLYRQDPFQILEFGIQVHELNGEKRGNALILSSSRKLNWASGQMMSYLGYETVTGIVVRDVEDVILPQYDQPFDILVLEPPIHAEHHELEDRLRFRRGVREAMRTGVDIYGPWRLNNIRRIYEVILASQDNPPMVFLDEVALRDQFQPDITEEGLHAAGIGEIYLVCASDLTRISIEKKDPSENHLLQKLKEKRAKLEGSVTPV